MRTHPLGDYTLCYDMNALAELEEIVGPLPALLVNTAHARSIKSQRAFVWAGLIRKHDVSIAEAGDIIDKLGMDVCAVAVQAAMRIAYPKFFPQDEGDEGDGPGKKKAG